MYSDEKATMASSERTPLLQTVRIAPRQQRYTHGTIRRFCTIALASSTIVVALLFLLPLGWLPGFDEPDRRVLPWSSPYPHEAWPQSEGLSYKELQDVLLDTPSEDKVREWSQYYTAGPHLAGKNLSQALWTMEKWQEFGVQDSSVIAYDIYINYPLGHRLALLEKSDTSQEASKKQDKGVSGIDLETTYKVKYECKMEEDVLKEDSTSGLPNRVPTFHGYSASGNVTAQYVYANFGTYQDFDDLVKANVSLKGNVALVKYGGIFRGLKVKRAQELGMVGTVIYTDPQEDGEITEANGYKPYPDGPARNPSSVQRGSTQFLSRTASPDYESSCIDKRRHSSWRPYHPRLSIQARCSSARPTWLNSFHTIRTYIIPRCSTDSQITEWTRT